MSDHRSKLRGSHSVEIRQDVQSSDLETGVTATFHFTGTGWLHRRALDAPAFKAVLLKAQDDLEAALDSLPWEMRP
jgi:hypothetical protein